MRKRRSFTPEFRAEAVRLALESDRPLAEIARELQVRPDQLRHWKQQVTRAAGAPAPSGETPEQELRRLRREVQVLRQEREFLKKAAAFFAHESR
jgi:transposase